MSKVIKMWFVIGILCGISGMVALLRSIDILAYIMIPTMLMCMQLAYLEELSVNVSKK